MKHLLVALVGAALWLAPGVAQACGCCDHHDHHATAPSTSQAVATLGPGEVRVEILVAGMHCSHCASRIEDALGRLDGVKTADVRLHDGKVIVVYDKAKIATPKIIETIDALGFKAGPPGQG